jgi:hypothetical protein
MPIDVNKIEQVARGIALARLNAVCIHLVNKMKENLSTPGRTSKIVMSRDERKERVKWGPLGSKPSQPGGFPAKQTGTLRSSVAYEIDPQTLTAKVGTSLRVGRWMELGTKGGKIITPKEAAVLANVKLGQVFGRRVVQGPIAPRPWLLRTVNDEKAAVQRILSGK